MAETIKIGGELESTATGNVAVAANHVKDKDKNKYQSEINEIALNDTYRKSETYSAAQLDNMITTPEIDYKDYDTYVEMLAETEHPEGAIYRVANYDGTQAVTNKYAEYSWDGTEYHLMAVRDHGIDERPTEGSNNLVKSRGVYEDIYGSLLYDNTITVAANTTRTDLEGNRLIGQTAGMGDTITFIKSVNFPMTRLVIRNSSNENVLDVTADFSKGVKVVIPDTQFYYIILHDSSSSSREFELTIREWAVNPNVEDNTRRIGELENEVSENVNEINSIKDNLFHEVLFEAEQNVEANTYRELITLPNSLKNLSQPKDVLVTGKSTGANKIIRFVVLNAVSSVLYDSQTEYGLVDFSEGIKVTIPTNGVYAYFFYGTNVSQALFSQTITMKIESTNELYNTEKTLENTLVTSVKNLNPKYKQFLGNISMGSKWMSTENNKPLVLAHISDIHADGMYLKRFVDFCTEFTSYINDMIHTGDSMNSYFDDQYGFDFWNNNGGQKILNLIGNHDSVDNNGQYTHNGVDVYNKFINPYKSYWGVILPAGAGENNYYPSYYYKDYITTGQKVRFIALNTTGDAFDATQQTWLSSVLDDARENEYHVIIANHYVPNAITRFNSAFCTKASFIGELALDSLTTVVKDFIDDGGIFVCHLTGHCHKDVLGKISADPRQLVVTIDKGGCNTRNGWEDSYRVNGLKSGDCFNLMAIDCVEKTIKIARIGNDMDYLLRYKDSICISYKIDQTHTEPVILYEH